MLQISWTFYCYSVCHLNWATWHLSINVNLLSTIYLLITAAHFHQPGLPWPSPAAEMIHHPCAYLPTLAPSQFSHWFTPSYLSDLLTWYVPSWLLSIWSPTGHIHDTFWWYTLQYIHVKGIFMSSFTLTLKQINSFILTQRVNLQIFILLKFSLAEVNLR